MSAKRFRAGRTALADDHWTETASLAAHDGNEPREEQGRPKQHQDRSRERRAHRVGARKTTPPSENDGSDAEGGPYDHDDTQKYVVSKDASDGEERRVGTRLERVRALDEDPDSGGAKANGDTECGRGPSPHPLAPAAQPVSRGDWLLARTSALHPRPRARYRRGAAPRRPREGRRSADRSFRGSPQPRGLPRGRTRRGGAQTRGVRARPSRLPSLGASSHLHAEKPRPFLGARAHPSGIADSSVLGRAGARRSRRPAPGARALDRKREEQPAMALYRGARQGTSEEDRGPASTDWLARRRAHRDRDHSRGR